MQKILQIENVLSNPPSTSISTGNMFFANSASYRGSYWGSWLTKLLPLQLPCLSLLSPFMITAFAAALSHNLVPLLSRSCLGAWTFLMLILFFDSSLAGSRLEIRGLSSAACRAAKCGGWRILGVRLRQQPAQTKGVPDAAVGREFGWVYSGSTEFIIG